MSAAKAAFSAQETHGIALRPENRLLVHSEGLCWQDVYASLAEESPWQGDLGSCADYCIALDVGQPAAVTRRLDDRTETATFLPRQFTIIPPDQPSWWQISGNPQVLLIYIRRSVFRRLAAELCRGDPEADPLRPVLAVHDPLVEQLALGILAALRNGHDSDTVYVDMLAQSMAAHLLRQHGHHPAARARAPAQAPAGRLQRLCDYIEAHLEERLSLDDLAAAAGLHPVYLARLFRRSFGVPPHQYIQQRRVERAKRLLLSTDQPLTEIALACGFASPSHFSTSFRRLVGCSPSAFRKGG